MTAPQPELCPTPNCIIVFKHTGECAQAYVPGGIALIPAASRPTRPPMRSTYTFATLDVSAAAYDEIKAKLTEAGYSHAFVDGAIDMHGIGLTRAGVVAWPGAAITPILSCPFCGTLPETVPLTSEDTTGENGGAPFTSWHLIRCERCGSSLVGARKLTDAIEQWNRRAPAAPSPSVSLELTPLHFKVGTGTVWHCQCGNVAPAHYEVLPECTKVWCSECAGCLAQITFSDEGTDGRAPSVPDTGPHSRREFCTDPDCICVALWPVAAPPALDERPEPDDESGWSWLVHRHDCHGQAIRCACGYVGNSFIDKLDQRCPRCGNTRPWTKPADLHFTIDMTTEWKCGPCRQRHRARYDVTPDATFVYCGGCNAIIAEMHLPGDAR